MAATHLATITQDDSQYVDRLWTLLVDSGIDPHEFQGLEYFGLTPFFVLAGATVRPQAHAHGDHLHLEGVIVELGEDLPEEGFYEALAAMLADAYRDDPE